jgi:8-oxo-dGTP diphosphatase
MPLSVTSAGGVVYRAGPDGPLILMIADRQGRWSFPKGMVDAGEEPADAARREVREETGVEGEVLSLLGETHYFFRQGGQVVSKKVYFYLIRAVSRAITPQLSEVADARWFPAEEALRRSAFAANTELLRNAIAALQAAPEAPST